MCCQSEKDTQSDHSVALGKDTIHMDSNPRVPVDPEARSAFALKVYCVFALQMLVSFLGIFCFLTFSHRYDYLYDYGYHGAIVVLVVVLLLTNCFKSVRNTYPLNIALFIISTGACVVLIGGGSYYNRRELLWGAAGAGAIVSLIVMMMAKYSPNEIKCSCCKCVVAFVHQTSSILLVYFALSYLANTIVMLTLGGIAFLITLRILFGPSMQCKLDCSDSPPGQCFSASIGFKNKIFSYSVRKGKSHEEKKGNGVDQMV